MSFFAGRIRPAGRRLGTADLDDRKDLSIDGGTTTGEIIKDETERIKFVKNET